jgi:hypothetical protein
LRCYCGRGWVSDGSDNSMAAAINLGGIAATGLLAYRIIRGPIATGSPGTKDF